MTKLDSRWVLGKVIEECSGILSQSRLDPIHLLFILIIKKKGRYSYE
jgi:hypothetical protein